MSETILKCEGCEETIQEDDGYAISDITEKTFCYGCEQSDLEGASTLLKVHGDPEAEKVIFGSDFSRGEYDESPDWFYELFGEEKGRVWEKTSGWRGHYNTIENFKDVTVLASGWTTGWADESTQRKARFNEFGENVCENFYGSVAPVYFMMEPTSNVFSSSVDFFCHTKDVEKVTAWLDEIGYPVATLKDWLG
jgi:hypothetical protein